MLPLLSLFFLQILYVVVVMGDLVEDSSATPRRLRKDVFADGGGRVISKREIDTDSEDMKLNDCLQEGRCGVFPICSYSFSYDCGRDYGSDYNNNDNDGESKEEYGDEEEPCLSYDGDDEYGDSSGTTRRVQGNIVLMKNGMDAPSTYKWEIIGQEDKLYEDYPEDDDSDLRTYRLPRKSYAYADTTVHFRHRIRLYGYDQVIDTITSSDKECTIKEACQYLSKACQASFAFSASPDTTELRKRCKEYSRACGYFVYEPDMFHEAYRAGSRSPNADPTSPGSGNNERDTPSSSSSSAASTAVTPVSTMALEASVEKMKQESSQCVTDCLWNYFPVKYLPADKGALRDKVESIWILRRTLLGMGLRLNECSDVEFVDDKINLFRTNEDENGEYNFVDREASQTHSKEVAIIVILVIVLIVLLTGIVVYWVNYVRGRQGATMQGMGGTYVRGGGSQSQSSQFSV